MATDLTVLVENPKVIERYSNALGGEKEARNFLAGLTTSVNNNPGLMKCDPKTILAGGLTAASLNLSLSPQLGYSWLVPMGNKASYQLGYKGLIALCLRSGTYKTIKSVEVYEDELVHWDGLLEEAKFTPVEERSQRMEGADDKIIGYWAKIVMHNGFEKEIYMTKNAMTKHSKKYSRMAKAGKGVWSSDVNAMSKKTLLRLLLGKYGVLSPEMEMGLLRDQSVSSIDSYEDYSYEDNPAVDVEIEVDEDAMKAFDTDTKGE